MWVRLIVWSQENGQLSGDYITKENISLTHKHLAPYKFLEKVSFYTLSTFYYSVVRGTILCGSQASNHCFPEFSSITVKTFPEPTFHNTSFSSPGSDLLSVLFPVPFHEPKRSVIDVLFMAGEFCSRSLSLLWPLRHLCRHSWPVQKLPWSQLTAALFHCLKHSYLEDNLLFC